MDKRYAEKHGPQFHELLSFLARIPAVQTNDSPWCGFGTGEFDDGGWWVKFSIDIGDDHAWHTVQELGHVLNLLSVNDRLPSVFKPVSPPPYLNGGPEEYLSWVIEVTDSQMPPGTIADWLSGRLPDPVDDRAAWSFNSGDEDDD